MGRSASGEGRGSFPRHEPHTGFVGRERELAELSALIQECRLLCLVGPGGVGKTRLAVELARRLEPELPVTFVALEQIRDPSRVTAAIAAQAGVRDVPGTGGDEALVAALGDTPRLIVLDAAEHAREAVAAASARLLLGAPALRILVTSRRAPGSADEVCWAVPPLDCAPPGADRQRLTESDAVRLFLARARERAPRLDLAAAEPELVGELCRRLGGLPLAIELTAGWTGMLSIREILDHRATLLDGPEAGGGSADRPVLRDVIEASYLLLDEAERALLPRLTVFAGPFTLHDAHTVTGVPTADLLHRIRALVDASWLHAHGDGQRNRFVLLETIRAFAAARLAEGEEGEGGGEDGEAALRERHARHFAATAIASEDALTTPDAPQWRARLDAEWPDVEQALDWAHRNGENELGLQAAAALWRWWLTSGRLTEGRSWLDRLLTAPHDRAGPPGARALASASILASESGDYARGAEQGAAALRVFEARGDRAAAAFAATAVGSAHRYLGDLAAARRYFERAMDQRKALADRHGVAVSLNSLALLALDESDLERALDLFEQSLLLKRQLGEPRAVALGLINLSDVLMRARRFARARHAVEEALVLAAELGDSQLIGTLRCNQARLDEEGDDWTSAAAHYAEAVDGHRAAGHRHDTVVALVGHGRALHRLGRGTEAVTRLREAEALAVDIGNAADLAGVRAGLAEIGELSRTPPPPGITAREAEVLGLLGRGLTNREIAAALYLSVPTVERHLATAYRKLGLRGRVEAARYAVAHGLAPAPR